MTLAVGLSVLVSVVALVAVGVLGWAALRHLPHLARLPKPVTTPPQTAAAVSVIVPARNEERRLPACLEALARQDYPAYEVIVVDDESTDRTAAVVRGTQRRHARLRLLPGAPLPQGWVGKPWALHQAAQAARGEWLFFVDADAICAPDTLRLLVAHAGAHALGALTLLPLQEVRTPWECGCSPPCSPSCSAAWTRPA